MPRVAAAILAVAFLTHPRPSPSQGRPLELDAVVVDRDGRPVPGLQVNDFQLKEDGRPVEIERVREVSAAREPDAVDSRLLVVVLDDSSMSPSATLVGQNIARMLLSRLSIFDRNEPAVSVIRLSNREDDVGQTREEALHRISQYVSGSYPLLTDSAESSISRLVRIARRLRYPEHRRKTIVGVGTQKMFDIDLHAAQGDGRLWKAAVDLVGVMARANTALYVIDPAGAAGFRVRSSGDLVGQTGVTSSPPTTSGRASICCGARPVTITWSAIPRTPVRGSSTRSSSRSSGRGRRCGRGGAGPTSCAIAVGADSPCRMPWEPIAMIFRALIVGLALALAATAGGSAQRRPLSDQQILIQLERDWDRAFLGNDVGFIETVLADEFMAGYADGSRGDRKRELTLAAEFDKKIDSSTLDDFTVKIYGDTAVVWFTRRLVGPSQGTTIEVTYRYLDVFVWRADRWQCVASHSNRVK
jgi:hypothetical protein